MEEQRAAFKNRRSGRNTKRANINARPRTTGTTFPIARGVGVAGDNTSRTNSNPAINIAFLTARLRRTVSEEPDINSSIVITISCHDTLLSRLAQTRIAVSLSDQCTWHAGQ